MRPKGFFMDSIAAGEGKQQPHARLWNRLTEVRHQQFVGRTPERTLFEAALAAVDLPFFVLYIFGPGGVGKTTLLHELAYISGQAATQALYLDARDFQPSPEGFLEALRLALHLPPAQSPLETLLAQPQRRVLLIDTYETLASLDNWLVKVFLPELPENILLVLAGRQGPSPAWQADPGLRALTRVVPLRNFSPEESQLFLARRALPSEQYQTILNFTHGHPLALSLVADKFAQNGDVFGVRAPVLPTHSLGLPGASASQAESEAGPDLIKTLLQRLIQEAPSAAHRAALEVCCLVRVTTEPLLAELLEIPGVRTAGVAGVPAAGTAPAEWAGKKGGSADAYELFDWLRNLSFIQFGPRGLFPHDLTQNVLDADLRWRNPDRYLELVERARHYYLARILSLSKGPQVSSQEQQALVIDYIFLYRHSPIIQPFVKVSPTVAELPDLARPADWPLLVEMVARHEGQEAARLAEFWFSRQPQGVVVWRRADGGGGLPGPWALCSPWP